MMNIVKVQTEDFDLSREITALRNHNAAIGAIVSFVGVVRDLHEGIGVQSMELEHYPGMTESALQDIVMQACQRWALLGTLIIHRVGVLKPVDQIVLVAVASAHRGEAFAACEFIMDYLKTQAPFWKKEQTSAGTRWVDARDSDAHAIEKWK